MESRAALFVVDASAQSGLGHLFRCVSLARNLCRLGWTCSFIVGPEAKSKASVSGLSDFAHEVSSVNDLPFLERSLNQLSAKRRIVIIDNYDFSQEAERYVSQLTDLTVVFDDLPRKAHVCDILIDQNIGASKASYAPYVDQSCRVLSGPSYANLNGAYLTHRPRALSRRESRNGKIDRILVTMGGGDCSKVITTVVDGIGLVPKELKVDVVVSSFCSDFDDLMSRFEENRGWSIHVDVPNMWEKIIDADLAIGSGGVSSLERCVLGLPTLLVELSENQRQNICGLNNIGAGIKLGNARSISPESVASGIERMLVDPEMTSEIGLRAARLCDGLGGVRLATFIEDSLAK